MKRYPLFPKNFLRCCLLVVGVSATALVASGPAAADPCAGPFACIAAKATSLETQNTKSHWVQLPADITAGDLLMVFFVTDGNALITSGLLGWTIGAGVQNGTALRGKWLYRLAEGDEGTWLSIGTNSREKSAHLALRIENHGHKRVEVPIDPENDPEGPKKLIWDPALSFSNNLAGTSAAPKPAVLDFRDPLPFQYKIDFKYATGTTLAPCVDPNGIAGAPPTPTGWDPDQGIDNYLWIAAAAFDRERKVKGYPDLYEYEQTSSVGGGSTGVGVMTAARQLNGNCENPGTFEISKADQWFAFTVGVHPAVAP